jgi:hypothetical protein
MGIAQRAREESAAIAARARHVRIREERVTDYAASLGNPEPYPAPAVDLPTDDEEARAALHLTLDAVNFGSGWFPTLRKREGCSGYFTIALGIRDRGPWSALELGRLRPADVAAATGQDPHHELMALYARHLNELGRRVHAAGSFAALARRPQLADHLATWPTFADPPFFKRAQITAYDVVCAGLAPRGHEGDLTIFADNLVPHVLRLDGLLRYEPALLARIDRGELLEHGSLPEVEIRACALHAVELLVAQREDLTATGVDNLLWHRGQGRRYKALPRHRARCEAY